MPEFKKLYPLLSLCGLNCGLCPRFHTNGSSRCPGCGGQGFLSKRPACGVITCSLRHGGIEYCFLCSEYPCKKYEGAAQADSFITHRNMLKDFEKAKTLGLDAYRAELDEKVSILQNLLDNYNDNRKKGFFCLAVNLLPLPALRAAMLQIAAEALPEQPAKEKAACAASVLQQAADQNGIEPSLSRRQP